MSLIIHQIFSILFLFVLPLPIIAFVKSRNGASLQAVSFWKALIMLANLGLFVSLITGFIIYPNFTSIRAWFAVVLVLIIGAFLGIFSKQLKLYRTETKDEAKQKYLKKITNVGFAYIAIIIVTFVFMSNWYNF